MFGIQPRDRGLFSTLAKYGVLSTERIADIFFQGIAHTTVMRRLRKLEEREFILRLSGLPNSMNGWCLTKRGADTISAGVPFRYSNKNVLQHEVILSDVRIALESIDVGENWTSEMEMRRAKSWSPTMMSSDVVIPDGVFVAYKNGTPKVVAVELELTPKNHARYARIFRHYVLKDTLNHVWYLASDVSIANLVRKRWQQAHRYKVSPTLIVSLLDEVLKSPRNARVWTFDAENPAELQNIFDCKSGLDEDANRVRVSAQQVSNSDSEELSRQELSYSKSDQRDRSAPDFQIGVPSALDPSPSTLVSREGSRPTGTNEKSGADEKEMVVNMK